MKLVKYGAIAAMSAALIASGAAGFNSKAAEKENGSEEGYKRTMESQSDVNFVPNDDDTKPIDPTDPTNPTPPTPKPPKPGTPGPLSIDYASDFGFGTQEITTETVTYLAKPQEYEEEGKETPTYVQVTDKRGSNAGWSLNLKQDHQFKSEGTQNEYIEGAELHFLEGEAVTDGNGTKPSTHEAKLDPITGAYSKIMTAEKTEGTGTWASMFGGAEGLEDTEVIGEDGEKVTEKRDKGVTLTIPGASQTDATEYSTTLNWQLTNEPGNGEGNGLGEE